MNKIDELKEIKAQKKELLAKQKELSSELESTKEDRRKARAEIAECKRQISERKSELLKQLSQIPGVFTTWDEEILLNLSNSIKETCSSVTENMDKLSSLVNIVKN